MSRLRLYLLLCLILVLASVAGAQVSTSTLRGSAADSTGLVIPGATVVATQDETRVAHSVVTGADGSFVLPFLPVGSYTLRVSHDGFSTSERRGIVLAVGQDVSIPTVLQAGGVQETVTVMADAPMLDTTSTETSALVSEKQVEGLPLNGRNPANLMFLVGGVTNPIQNVPTTNTSNPVLTNSLVFPSEIAPTVHGIRGGGVYFSLDGANNVDSFEVAGGPFPNPDATREFSVVSGVFGAKYFSAPGGAVNIVTKSGTNRVHGNAFEFIRNEGVNARNYFATRTDILKRNQFGGTLGGPILHDRWFLFGSYQRTNLSQLTQGLKAIVPTAAQRATPNINPVIKNLLQYIPVPTTTDGSVLFSRPHVEKDNQYTARTDVAFKNHQVFGRYFYEFFTLAPTGIPGGSMLGTTRGQVQHWYNATVGDTWTHGNLINDLRVGYIRDHSETVAGQNKVTWQSLGANIPAGQFPTLQGAGVTGFFNIGAGNYNDFPRDTYTVSEDVNLLHGRHQMAFGVSYQHFATTLRTDNTQNPTATFNGSITGNAINDFLTGQLSALIQSDGLFVQATGTLPGFYAEDKYRVTDQLTLTGGIRWDPYIAFKPFNARMMCYQPGVQSTTFVNAPIGETFPGDAGCAASGAHNQYAIVEPRLGFAYQPAGMKNLVIHGGYGVYSTQFALASFLAFGSTQPFERTFNLSFSPTSPASISDPYATFPGGNPYASGYLLNGDVRPSNSKFINPASAFALDSKFKLQSVQSFSLVVDTTITNNDFLSLGYFGTTGHHQSAVVDLNQPVFVPGIAPSKQASAQSRRPNQLIGTLRQEISSGNSSYNGLEAGFRHRARGGVEIQSTFDWSKAMDDASSPANVLLTGGSLLPSPTNLHDRHALADFDQNYTWRTSVVWNVPWLRQASGMKRLLGGWQVNTILVDDAGLPFSVTDPSNASATSNGLEYADRVPGISTSVPSPGPLAYFDKAAYTTAAAATYGNSGRNSLRAPNYFNIDAGVVKSFRFRENLSMVVRVESFNTLNHSQFLPPNAALNSPLTGTITTARDPRILQGSTKIVF